MAVRRIYVTKRKEHAVEAGKLLNILKDDENISCISNLLILNRYDIEGLTDAQLNMTINTVFAEPMVDDIYMDTYYFSNNKYFSIEYLPGQYDQRADSAEQCIKVITGADNVRVRCAKTYVLSGSISDTDLSQIISVMVNTIDQRIAGENIPDTLALHILEPEKIKVIDNFINLDEKGLQETISSMGLAMNIDDIKFSQDYFKNQEKRNPTETELKLLDTYWSDHCRHTTFNTILENIDIEEGKYCQLFKETLDMYYNLRNEIYNEKISSKPVCLMDMAVIGARDAKRKGLLNNLEESEENNACSIEIDVNVNNNKEKWLLQFKNETHNHPTEIEPFGGAATCVGGAIRDPLSGRAYVYQSMRITGAADPREPMEDFLKGKKLSQRKIVQDAAKGFSSYGNQIGLTTGYVQEFYHDGFTAKRLETGAVIGACPKNAVTRLSPEPDDVVILIGGRTGRDGVGGATGSSKEHDASSIEICGAEVQKGNAPEEHKIQRLFRKENVSKIIKKCNDFGAGGVGVAIGELAAGLEIDLNKVPKKYEGLTGTEIALSESQERMAVVVNKEDVDTFISECKKENLEATIVAKVTNTNRLQMMHDGKLIVDISRDFLDSAGASRSESAFVSNPQKTTYIEHKKYNNFKNMVENTLSDLNICSQKGLVEMFDSTIGASSVITPFGGKTGNTPAQSMIAKIPVLKGDTTTVSIMASGYNPYIMEWSPYHGAYYAVIESVSKIAAAGGKLEDIRLSFQEYFERLSHDKTRWGKPVAALLGALKAQTDLGLAAIGGKDSMSGTFKDSETGRKINVPPTLISFAVAPSDLSHITTNQIEHDGGNIYLLKTSILDNDLIDINSFKENLQTLSKLISDKVVKAVYTVTNGGVIEALSKMAFGNMVGLNIKNIELHDLTFPYYASFIIQAKKGYNISGVNNITEIAEINSSDMFSYNGENIKLLEMLSLWQKPLEHIFPSCVQSEENIIHPHDFNGRTSLKCANIKVQPSVAVLALPGTNCEYDTKRIFETAGSKEIKPFIFRNLTTEDAVNSCNEFADIINKSQILVLPGGFSAGDEPEGSGKFYVSVLKHAKVRQAVDDLINKRDGLIIGICNGFQALIKTGILTYGHICDLTSEDATLSFNKIGRHVSQMVRTRVTSVNSPWMNFRQVGEIDIVPVSHGEGRFTAPKPLIDKLFNNGQILFQYVDLDGNITMQSPFNPNGSDMAIEGMCSPCGRALGKMGHSERFGNGVHMNNQYGNMDQRLFESGVKYFTGEE